MSHLTNFQSPLLCLLLPLSSAVFITLFLQRRPNAAQFLSVAAAAFFAVIALNLAFTNDAILHITRPYLQLGTFTITLGILLNPLAVLMLAIVAIVGLCVHVFSIGYMRDDPDRPRYFAGLSIFMFSMAGIVLADNLYMMFIFWELVGFSSWFLINHYNNKSAPPAAANKAFITNRVGDFGFLLGIIATHALLGTANLSQLSAAFNGTTPANLPALIPIALFCGAIGKSAQFPLHVWLPDAMEGPTPVSALIHAATMVAAGIYMLCRLEPLFSSSQLTLNFILIIGLITALYAALCAITQRDIKKILAYSTLSQLGYMTAAFGLGSLATKTHDGSSTLLITGAAAAMFHLTTHAFFKALLFLGSGSIIAGNHHEQDIFNYGGLWKKMPLTFITFTIGVLAIIGLPFLSGFFSKDAILYLALTKNTPAFIILAFTAILTALYMTRLWIITFFGKPRSETATHAKETVPSMGLPLLILAALAVIGGYTVLYPQYFSSFLSKIPLAHSPDHILILATSLLVLIIGTSTALLFYNPKKLQPATTGTSPHPKNSPLAKGEPQESYSLVASRYSLVPPDPLQQKLPRLFNTLALLQSFPDTFYRALGQRLLSPLCRLINLLDQLLIAGLLVRFPASLLNLLGQLFRKFHTGTLRPALWLITLGTLTLLLYLTLK